MTGLHSKPRVGILSNSKDPLCGRWATPFEKMGVEVSYIESQCETDVEAVLFQLDGLFLPGGDAHIHPFFVQGNTKSMPETCYDFRRDLTAIALVQRAYEMDIPTLGICRGMQEMIAAYGGKLEKLEDEIHAKGYEYAGDFVGMDNPVHDITFVAEGQLRKVFAHICDAEGRVAVNSIHYEGITQAGWNSEQSQALRQRFAVEAVAPDGVIEGISGLGKSFFIGLQAHFELSGPLHDALFGAFEGHIVEHYEKTLDY